MYTKHGNDRANQRGFSSDWIDLIRDFGSWEGDKQNLCRRDLLDMAATLTTLKAKVLHLLDKGGGTAVFTPADTLITIYTPRKRIRKKTYKVKSDLSWG